MNTKILFNEWENVTLKYTADTDLCHNIFNELIAHYAESGRYYHNLTHIETMLKDLHTVYEDGLPDALFFAVWFHDAVYNALFKNIKAQPQWDTDQVHFIKLGAAVGDLHHLCD